MIWKNKISKKEYKEIIDEVLLCQKSLNDKLEPYTANAIARLISARVKLETSEIDESLDSVKEKG